MRFVEEEEQGPTSKRPGFFSQALQIASGEFFLKLNARESDKSLNVRLKKWNGSNYVPESSQNLKGEAQVVNFVCRVCGVWLCEHGVTNRNDAAEAVKSLRLFAVNLPFVVNEIPIKEIEVPGC